MYKTSSDDQNKSTILLYVDVQIFYFWTKKWWERRKIGKRLEKLSRIFEANVLGWVYTISPQGNDLYYLGLFLHYIIGLVFFESLKTHNENILIRKYSNSKTIAERDNCMEDAERRTRIPRAMKQSTIHNCGTSSRV